jgi:hypothetical protein
MGISKIGYPIRGENFKITIDFCYVGRSLGNFKIIVMQTIHAILGIFSKVLTMARFIQNPYPPFSKY